MYSDRFLKYYMDIAERTAQMSYAKRLQVGSVLVVDNSIIATGFNGTPAGHDNCCEHEVDGKLVTKDTVIHAEDNVLRRVRERGLYAAGGTMFITHAPCVPCAIKMAQNFVKEVYYKNDYRDFEGVFYLRSNKISIHKMVDS